MRKKITIRLPEELIEAADRCAIDQHRTRANLILHALEGYLSRYGHIEKDKSFPVHAQRSGGDL